MPQIFFRSLSVKLAYSREGTRGLADKNCLRVAAEAESRHWRQTKLVRGAVSKGGKDLRLSIALRRLLGAIAVDAGNVSDESTPYDCTELWRMH